MLFLRNTPVDVLRYLPDFLAEDKAFKNVQDGLSKEHERLRLRLAKLADQLFIPTAGEEGISSWERVIGLIPRADADLEARRRAVLLWLQSNQVSTVEFMQRLAARYFPANANVEIQEHNDEYYFDINSSSLPIDADGLVFAIELYKPAHLGYGLHSRISIDSMLYLGAVCTYSRNYCIMQKIEDRVEFAASISIGSVNDIAKKYEIQPLCKKQASLECKLSTESRTANTKHFCIKPKNAAGNTIHVEVAIGNCQQTYKS